MTCHLFQRSCSSRTVVNSSTTIKWSGRHDGVAFTNAPRLEAHTDREQIEALGGEIESGAGGTHRELQSTGRQELNRV